MNVEALCNREECDHLLFISKSGWSNETCACHLNPGVVPEEILQETIMHAALENDDFEVDREGNIRLKEEGV